MKRIALLSLALGSLMILSNCSPSYGPHFTTTGSKIERNVATEEAVEVVEVPVYEEVVVEEIVEVPSLTEEYEEKVVETVEVVEVIEEPVVIEQPMAVEEVVVVEEQPISRKEMRREIRERKKEFRSVMKERIREMRDADDSEYLLMMVLAILIPPLGVALTYGLENEFLISLILTLLFFLPGMIYSLIMVHRYFN